MMYLGPEIIGYMDGYEGYCPFWDKDLSYAQQHFEEYMIAYDEGMMDDYLDEKDNLFKWRE